MRKINPKYRRAQIAAACVAMAAMVVLQPASLHAQTHASPAQRPVTGVKVDKPIKAVYQVTADAMKDGVSKGLSDLKAVYEGYVEAGIDPAHITMKAVFHSKASSHLLTDEAWNKHHKTNSGNPNSPLIAELTGLGIELELCDLARTANNWEKNEIHPDVTLVGNAYHRLVELQTQGFFYVKF